MLIHFCEISNKTMKLEVLITSSLIFSTCMSALAADSNVNSSLNLKHSLVRVETSPLSLAAGSFVAAVNFAMGDHFSIGPSLGLHPLYFLTPGNAIFAYDLGVDSNISVFGSNSSSSWFINPYLNFGGFHSYRAEQPSLHG